jgi:hypothetical protein
MYLSAIPNEGGFDFKDAAVADFATAMKVESSRLRRDPRTASARQLQHRE